MPDFEPQKTIENFLTMVDTFGRFESSQQALHDLARAVRDLQNSNRNLTDRNALLRQRPDLPVDRIPVHAEMKRLQELEAGLLNGGLSFDGVSLMTLMTFRDTGRMPQDTLMQCLILELAIDAMQCWRDERGVVWLRPTAYAYAMTCKALAKEKQKNSK